MTEIVDFINVNSVGLFLTVSGLIIAGWQTRQNLQATKRLQRMTEHFQGMTETMEVIKERLSTEYLSEFPHYMPHVDALIVRAKRSVCITYIYPAPGAFSVPDSWRTYKAAIESALRLGSNIRVRAVFPTEAIRRIFLEENFATQEWEKWRSDSAFLQKLKSFINRYSQNGLSETSISFEDFMGLSLDIDREALNQVYYGADLFEIDFRPQLYSWIIDDGEEAIFVIPIFKPVFTAHAFWTADRKLTQILLSLNEELCRTGRQLGHSENPISHPVV